MKRTLARRLRLGDLVNFDADLLADFAAEQLARQHAEAVDSALRSIGALPVVRRIPAISFKKGGAE